MLVEWNNHIDFYYNLNLAYLQLPLKLERAFLILPLAELLAFIIVNERMEVEKGWGIVICIQFTSV